MQNTLVKVLHCKIVFVKVESSIIEISVNVLNDNTVRTEGIRINLYFIMSSISVRHCCIYQNMVCINSVVNVKQKQT